jgi:hypothetical protein
MLGREPFDIGFGGEGSHNSCHFHVVWCPKYRRPVLVDGIDVRKEGDPTPNGKGAGSRNHFSTKVS